MHWAEGIAEREPIKRGDRTHPRVVRLVYTDGQKLVLKVGKTPATARCESSVLQTLAEYGAPVPELVEHDDRGLLILENIPGTTLGNLPLAEARDGIPEFFTAWSRLSAAWERAESALQSLATVIPRSKFAEQMRTLGDWICPRAPHPGRAARAWKQLVELAVSAPRSLGSLDYNPYNVIRSRSGFVFVDFESIGFDWQHRRLWQYTTRIRDSQGQPCWQPVLRPRLASDPIADAHYILFAARALKRNPWKESDPPPAERIWDERGAEHPATTAWRQAWDLL